VGSLWKGGYQFPGNTFAPESILELFFDGAKQKRHGCGYVALCLFVPITPLFELFEPVFCGWIAWKR